MTSSGKFYSGEEKSWIIELAKEQAHIIENQENNININRKKNEMWQEITKQINSKFNTNRCVKSVINIYRKMKMRAKNEISEQKRHRQGTGGGPSRQISEVAESFSDFLPPITTEGIDNPYDDDTIPESTSTPNPTKNEATPISKKSAVRSRRKNADAFMQREHLKRMEVLEAQLKCERTREAYYAAKLKRLEGKNSSTEADSFLTRSRIVLHDLETSDNYG